MNNHNPRSPNGQLYHIRRAEAKSILAKTSGFIAEAGFSHSLTPARNCTFGCTYCYVPTLRVYGGLKPEDWKRWGQFTTFKSNAPELLYRAVRSDQKIYCSPLVDPYQPAEETEQVMPKILRVLIRRPPKVFVIQTRGPLILRDLQLLAALQDRTDLKVSFSLTTNRDEVRRLYEPHCASIAQRLTTIEELRRAGITVHATLAPLLPCDPEVLARLALAVTNEDVIGDPFHVRSVRPHGAVTREAAYRIASHHGFEHWHEPAFQNEIVERIRMTIEAAGRNFGIGPEAFGWLAQESKHTVSGQRKVSS